MNESAKIRRPDVPEDLKRSVLVEAGHRCAIPTCKATTTEIAHIVPWSDCREHEFANLIALCPNCHTRFDQGQIDRKSMRTYKRNLGLLTSRYGDLERRVLRVFAENPDWTEIRLPGGLDMLLWYLLEDGLLEDRGPPLGAMVLSGLATAKLYRITDDGRRLVNDWTQGGDLK